MNPFQNLTKQDETTSEPTRARTIAPPVDVFENNDEYVFLVDMPGVNEDGLRIRWEKDRLYIDGRRPQDKTGDKVVTEYPNFDYSRTFRIPTDINEETVAAKYEQGVLRVVLPKAERAKPREIRVRTE